MITEKLQVQTPTKKDFKKVVQCMLDNGNVWSDNDKNVCEDVWNCYENYTNVCLGYWKDNKISVDDTLKPNYTIYTTKEFLDKYGEKLVEDNKAYLVEIATQLKEEDKK